LNADIKLAPSQLRPDVQIVSVPFKQIVSDVTDSVKLRKLLLNMAYVGVLVELMGIGQETVDEVIEHQFGDKPAVFESNKKAIAAGRAYARDNLKGIDFP
jgi:Pyruvate/2-oxoacid:ferredoxin oxidoreductase gamma subunit